MLLRHNSTLSLPHLHFPTLFRFGIFDFPWFLFPFEPSLRLVPTTPYRPFEKLVALTKESHEQVRFLCSCMVVGEVGIILRAWVANRELGRGGLQSFGKTLEGLGKWPIGEANLGLLGIVCGSRDGSANKEAPG